MSTQKMICAKQDNSGYEVVDWNSDIINLPPRYIANCPLDPETLAPATDLSLLTINRFYIDDSADKHIIQLSDVLPSREKILNVGMPGPQVSGLVKYPEHYEVLFNDANLETFHGTEIEKVKKQYIAKVIKDCDTKIAQLKVGYSDSEVQSWAVKKQLAIDWLALTAEYKTVNINDSVYALIVNEAGGTTDLEKISNTTSLAGRVLALASIFESYCGSCVRVKKTTVAEMNAVSDTLSGTKTQLEVIYSSIVWPTIPAGP